MVYLIVNEAAWAIDYQSTWFPGAEAQLFIHEWTKKKENDVQGYPKTKQLNF